MTPLPLLLLFLTHAAATDPPPHYDYGHEGKTEHWLNDGQQWLRQRLDGKPFEKSAQNIAIVIGDGYGVTVNTAARIYKNQKENLPLGTPMAWEELPNVGFVKTRCIDYHTTDSAAAATALLTGVKPRLKTISVGPEVGEGNCTAALLHSLHSIFTWAQNQGKWTGLVTTTPVTHATVAAAYASTPSRWWADDSLLPEPTQCKDIARQLVENSPGRHLKVIMGGGRGNMMPTSQEDPGNAERNASLTGSRLDGRNLIHDWLELGGERTYVWNSEQLAKVNASDYRVDHVLGLFAHDNMDYELLRGQDSPSLEEMTRKSVEILSRAPKGFLLLVEGGMIDKALHLNQARLAMEESRALHRTFAMLRSRLGPDTLLVFTADHSHPLNLVGYPHVSTDILGVFHDEKLADGLPLTPLVFANGPGAADPGHPRPNISHSHDPHFESPTFMKRPKSTHGGEDVGIFAQGPYAHLFSGVMENHHVGHALAMALCGGPSRDLCLQRGRIPPSHGSYDTSGSSGLEAMLVVAGIIIAALLIIIFAMLARKAFRQSSQSS